ncbi:MAG: hypothetical protein JWO62_2385 [Acidimicrobiaceae bacterium]|jgi:hypothetical protein|nr:hypothetical protein [Acidimicrobiaceae bacterium]
MGIGRTLAGQGWHPTPRRAAVLVLALTTAGLLGTACGGGSGPGVAKAGSSTDTSTATAAAGNSGPPPSAKLQQAQLDYSRCMRSHGVTNFPDPLTGGYPDGYMKQIDPNASPYTTATKDCQSLASSADMAPYTKAQMAAHIAAMLKISECMHAHRITGFPEPDAQGGFTLPVGGSSSSVDFSSPRYAAAAKACNGPPGRAPKGG